jgi:hypothetical protein
MTGCVLENVPAKRNIYPQWLTTISKKPNAIEIVFYVFKFDEIVVARKRFDSEIAPLEAPKRRKAGWGIVH